MSKTRVFTTALALSLATSAQAKMTDVQCDASDRLQATLSGVMGAERQGMGLRDPETMLEVWVTVHNGDWLIVQTYANGTSCIVAMGEHWDGPAAGPA